MTAYDRQTFNAPNPLARLAHRSRYGVAERLIGEHLRADGSMLDFGCGDGRMLVNIRNIFPDAELFGYEPIMKDESGGAYRHFSSEDLMRSRKYDLITAFEVLEHLEPEEIEGFVRVLKENLSENGTVLVSVPIMLGPVLIPKVFNAQVIRKTTWRYSAKELISAAFFLGEVPRYKGKGYLTHKGFDWRNVRDRLGRDLRLERQEFSPFPWLPWGLNSQWFGTFRA